MAENPKGDKQMGIFPPSTRKGILEMIGVLKAPLTREIPESLIHPVVAPMLYKGQGPTVRSDGWRCVLDLSCVVFCTEAQAVRTLLKQNDGATSGRWLQMQQEEL